MNDLPIYPFLISASVYHDYWAVVVPKGVKPLVIAKAGDRMGNPNEIVRKNVSGPEGEFEVLYSYRRLSISYSESRTSDDKDTVIRDKKGRPIDYIFGVWSEKIPELDIQEYSTLLDNAYVSVKPYLVDFLEESDHWNIVESDSFENFSYDKNHLELQRKTNPDNKEVMILPPLILKTKLFSNENLGFYRNENTDANSNSINVSKVEKGEGQEDEDNPALTDNSRFEEPKKPRRQFNRKTAKIYSGAALMASGIALSFKGGFIAVTGAIQVGVGTYLYLTARNRKENEV